MESKLLLHQVYNSRYFNCAAPPACYQLTATTTLTPDLIVALIYDVWVCYTSSVKYRYSPVNVAVVMRSARSGRAGAPPPACYQLAGAAISRPRASAHRPAPTRKSIVSNR